MKTLTLLAAIFAASLLMTTGCQSNSADNKGSVKTAAACDGSCCNDHDTCVKCCKDSEGCQKCCHKS